MSFDFVSAIKKFAPILAGTFGTPLIGMAVNTVCQYIPDPADAKAVQDAHAADPVNGAVSKLGDLLAQGKIAIADIAKAEAAHAETMAQLGYKSASDLAKIAADDRDSARKAAVSSGTMWPLFWLSILLLALTLGAELYVLMDGYPKQVPEIVVGRILGLFDSVAMLVLGFWYGTSKGSQTKDDTIAAMAKG